MEDTLKYYNAYAQEFIDNTVNLNMEELYNIFQAYLPINAKILDAGCGSGRDTKHFFECGYNVEAFDASIEICKIASVFSGIHVKNTTFDEFTSTEKYDGIWACASLLHIKKARMVSTLNKLLDCLAINGILYASWKYGNTERIENGKYYCDIDEEWIESVNPDLKGNIISVWKNIEIRKGRETTWINVLVKKEY